MPRNSTDSRTIVPPCTWLQILEYSIPGTSVQQVDIPGQDSTSTDCRLLLADPICLKNEVSSFYQTNIVGRCPHGLSQEVHGRRGGRGVLIAGFQPHILGSFCVQPPELVKNGKHILGQRHIPTEGQGLPPSVPGLLSSLLMHPGGSPNT